MEVQICCFILLLAIVYQDYTYCLFILRFQRSLLNIIINHQQSMQYINVSQFYQSILCFSIPLLIIQRILLCCFDLTNRYEDYRLMFYEDQFKFTKQYEYAVDEVPNAPKQTTIKDQMLETRQNNEDNEKKEKDIEAQHVEQNNQEQNRSRIQSFSFQLQPSTGGAVDKKQQMKLTQSGQIKRVNKITIDLETDRELKNSNSTPVLTKQKQSNEQKQEPKLAKKITSGKQQILSQSQADHKHETIIAEVEKTEVKKQYIQQIEQSRMSRLTHSDIQVRRQTQLDEDMQRPEPNQQEQQKNKEIIELGHGKLLQQGEQDKVRLKYCRRVDDAFNDYVPVIMSVIVLGILTKSVYIYSMCCFFGYAFTSLLFNYIHLLDRLEGINVQTVFGRANQLISSLFVIGLFISYWVSNQFHY